jgi:hypothetical protein
MIQVQNNINICEIVELGESMRHCITQLNPLLGLRLGLWCLMNFEKYIKKTFV